MREICLVQFQWAADSSGELENLKEVLVCVKVLRMTVVSSPGYSVWTSFGC